MNSLFARTGRSSVFRYIVFFKRGLHSEKKGVDTVLRISEFVIPKSCKVVRDDCHQRLIWSCMQDLLEIGKENGTKVVKGSTRRKLSDDCCELGFSSFWKRSVLGEEDWLVLVCELRKRDVCPDSSTLSRSISLCGAKGELNTGIQLHGFSVKIGLDMCTHIGSSLISLYSKCRRLHDAYRVFQLMPEKNTVSWTAIIAGYAQHWQLGTCLSLFNSMRYSDSEPNDFTCASLLSACTNCTSLALGKSFHSLEIKMGYDSYTHVSNSLISMYAKCGCIKEAYRVFEMLSNKDLISWNSMIFGYAHYGIADQALNLLKQMDEENIFPDAITFLGVLSSCRHSGFVDKGRYCFNLMIQHGIKPELDHYSCLVDLLGRAGLLEEAVDFIQKMPIPPNGVIWGSLLSSCKVHGNVSIGIRAAEKRLVLEPGCATTHVQLANLYASIRSWDNVAKIRKLLKDTGIKKTPGYSWIEIGNDVYRFKSEDGANNEIEEMLFVLGTLEEHMYEEMQEDQEAY